MLNEIIQRLQSLDSESTNGGISNHYFEVSNNDVETVISANREGLIWFALEALKLAENSVEGAHLHIDEYGIADKVDKGLVLSFKNANWSGANDI